MGIEIWEILLVWLTIGIVIGGWISVDTFRRKVEGARWIAVGIFLSVIGLALYLIARKKQKGVKQPEFHETPQYRHSEPAPQKTQSAPIAPVSGGSGPIVIPAGPEQKTPTSPDAAPAPVPEDIRPEHSWAPVIREHIEGIPRCPKCGSAVSSRDDFCSECGAKIK